jgi:phytoene dehydrogenase-like protein
MRQETEYETDFYEWTQSQAAKLRDAGSRRVNAEVDWENVAEEIESLGRSDLRSVESYLALVIQHLLKLEYSPAAEPRRSWRASVENHRRAAARLLKESPSLLRKVRERFPEPYDDAREDAAQGLMEDGVVETDLPRDCPYSLDEVTQRGWYPKNRHGLE